MPFDAIKHGFTLLEDNNSNRRYEYKVADMIICLLDVSNMFTLYFYQGERSTYVANRYIVETQEQLDFLILSGRVGWAFRDKSYMENIAPKKPLA